MKFTFSQSMPNGVVLVVLSRESEQTEMHVHDDNTQELSIGIKDIKTVTRRKVVVLMRRVVIVAKERNIKRVAIDLEQFRFDGVELDDKELGRLFAENVLMANYEFNSFKTKPKEGWKQIEEIIISSNVTPALKEGIKTGMIVGEEVNKCREISNTPGGDMTPALLARKATEAVKGTSVKVTVLGIKEMQKLGMGAVLGVARGSKEEPKFIVLEYFGASKKEKPTVLVGKGVTFDSGGLNIKTDDHMLDMHLDMSGGAAVIHAVVAAAKLGLKKNVIGLIPAVENAVGGESYRPGDILRSMSGKTIEVLNTDAEGRVILADALTYAKKYDPALVVDAATLTGAALVAIGTAASIIMTRNEELIDTFKELGETSGDYVWPLPLWEEYEKAVKGRFGDVANIPTQNSREGGSINGGMFLLQFADSYPWVHIDIAPRMTSVEGDNLAKGAAGAPVRLFVRLLEK
jgi:leucyl aminopeptidase